MSDFNEAPKGVSKKKGVLNWSKSTYENVSKFDGEQPYYTYQGIGRITATGENVVMNGIGVVFNNVQVIHTI
jgi:hypothetical protein